MKKGPITPKGFRDITPDDAKARSEIFLTVKEILEGFGFVPLETPTVEFAETLLGKYGEDEKLIYKFTDRGGRQLALRYDLTVPLARFVANNLGVVSPIFKRYQIGQVFRGENPQRGRYREFTQFDYDSVGTDSAEEDALIIATALVACKKIGFDKAKVAVNDRINFKKLSYEDIREIDKIYKVGKDNIKPELLKFIDSTKPTERLNATFLILKEKYQLTDDDFFFDPTLARGLDYYTGMILEVKPFGDPADLSIAGGGRYDELIGMFAGKKIPAVGASFGIDRIVALLKGNDS